MLRVGWQFGASWKFAKKGECTMVDAMGVWWDGKREADSWAGINITRWEISHLARSGYPEDPVTNRPVVFERSNLV